MSAKKKSTGKARSGTGSIVKRADGMWVGAMRFTDRNGKKVRKYVYSTDKAECERKLNDVRRMVEDAVPVLQSKDSVAAYVTAWATDILPVSNRRPSTVQTYQTIVRTLVVPGVGHLTLDTLTAREVEAWVTRLVASGKSASTIHKAVDILGLALDVAVRDGKVRTNAARDVDKPRITRTEVDFFTSDQVAALRQAAQGYRLDPLLTLAAFTGLRRGEALALRWRDVDLDRQQIRITGTLTRVKGRLVRQEPKTNAGTRVVPLVPEALQAIQAQGEIQQGDRAASPYWTNRAGYVFTTESGEPVDPANVGRWFAMIRGKAASAMFQADPHCDHHKPGKDGALPTGEAACRACGRTRDDYLPRGSWHTLRHSAASTLLRAGTPMIVVSRLLGHSKVQITLDLYGHLTNTDIAQAVAAGFTGYGTASTEAPNVVPIRAAN